MMHPPPPMHRKVVDGRLQEAVRSLQTRMRPAKREGKVVRDLPRASRPKVLVQRGKLAGVLVQRRTGRY
jgi:hypothetical protein